MQRTVNLTSVTLLEYNTLELFNIDIRKLKITDRRVIEEFNELRQRKLCCAAHRSCPLCLDGAL